MATPAQLMKVVSDATGVPLATVVDFDRRLVKANLRTKAGRGFNAAQMTARDAARLLVAILGSSQANAAAEAVERYQVTHPDLARSSDKLFVAAGLDELAALPAQHSFVQALTALISSAATGSLAAKNDASEEGWRPSLEVFAFTRAIRGRIRIAGLPGGLTASVEYGPASAPTKVRQARRTDRSQRVLTDENSGDLEQSRRITERTILPIARLLAKESQHGRF